MDKRFTVREQTVPCTLLFVRMKIVPMTLRQKTQNQVLGRSAGVPCEVASGLRSHLFVVLGSQRTLQHPFWTSSGHSRANTVHLVASRLKRFLPRCEPANWESEMLYNVLLRTFALT